MAELSLKLYNTRIENYLRDERYEEAIAHSARVLQAYPKNGDAYRALGRALLFRGREDEAEEIFRRLLAAYPDDFSAHMQLSIIYDRARDADAALWHIERAYDRQPNNRDVADRLRKLYRKYREIDIERIQLTAGAAANLYMQTHAYVEAINTLSRTLQRLPDRLDLRLALARALWENGDRYDAAETSLDILEQLPFCVDANLIVARLWLDEGRPSDARRYLTRVEDVDPYFAYEVVSGQTPSDDVYRLEELDYQRYMQRNLDTSEPDWLDSLEQSEVDFADFDFANDARTLTESETAEQPRRKLTDRLPELITDDLDIPKSAGSDDTATIDDDELDALFGFDDEDSTSIDDLIASDTGELRQRTGLSGMLGSLEDEDDDADDWLTEVESGDFDLLDEAESDDDEINALLNQFAQEADREPDEAPTAVVGDDGLDWLSFEDEEGDDAPDDEEDDLDWFDDEIDPGFSEAVIEEPTNDDEDPLAWLNESGFEVGETGDLASASSARLAESAGLEDASSVGRDDALAWLAESDIEFDESVPTAMESLPVEDEPVSFEDAESDPLAWLNESGVEINETQTTYETARSQPLPDDRDFASSEAEAEREQRGSGADLSFTDEFEMLLEGGEVGTADFASSEAEAEREQRGSGADLSFTDEFEMLLEGDEPAVDEASIFEEKAAAFAENQDAGDFDDESTLDWMLEQGDSVLDEFYDLEDLTASESDVPAVAQESLDDFDDAFDRSEESPQPMQEEALLSDNDWQDSDQEWEPEEDEDDPFAWLSEPTAVGDVATPEDEGEWMAQADTLGDPMAWLEESGVDFADEEVEAEDHAAAATFDPTAFDMGGDEFAYSPEDDEYVEEDEYFDDYEDDYEYEEGTSATAGMTGLLNFLGSQQNKAEEFDAALDEADDSELDWLTEEDSPSGFTDDFSFEPADVPQTGGVDWLAEFDDAEANVDLEQAPDLPDVPQTGRLDWFAEMPETPSQAQRSAEVDDTPDWLADLNLGADSTAEPTLPDGFDLPDNDWLSEMRPAELDEQEQAGDLIEMDLETLDLEGAEDDAAAFDDLFGGLDVEGSDATESDDVMAAFEIDEDDPFDGFALIGEDAAEPEDLFGDFETVGEAPTSDGGWWDEGTFDDDATEEADAMTGNEFDQLGSDFDDEDLQPAGADWLNELGLDDRAASDDDLFTEDFDEQAAWDAEEAVPSGMTDMLNEMFGLEESDAASEEDFLLEPEQGTEQEDPFGGALDALPDETETAASSSVDVAWLDASSLGDELGDDFAFEDDGVTAIPVAAAVDGGFLPFDPLEPVDKGPKSWGLNPRDLQNDVTIEPSDEEASVVVINEEDYEEELELTPAENAPDWLNAMVPGLDVDFDAPEDAPLDEGFEERRVRVLSQSGLAQADFQWLQEIVDEEEPALELPIDDDEVVPIPQTRFTFSRLPLWVRAGVADVADPEVDEGVTVGELLTSDNSIPDYLADFEAMEDTEAVRERSVDEVDDFAFDDLDTGATEADPFALDDLDFDEPSAEQPSSLEGEDEFTFDNFMLEATGETEDDDFGFDDARMGDDNDANRYDFDEDFLLEDDDDLDDFEFDDFEFDDDDEKR